jgi:multiple sugar transport system permease protein
MRRQAALAGHYAVLIVLAVACLFPIYVMLLTSFKVQTQIFSMPPVWFFLPTLSNYDAVINEARFGRYLANSLIVGLTSTVLTLLIGAMTAYALSRFRFMGRGVLSIGTLLLRTVPPAVLTVPVFVIWSDWGLVNELAGVILVYVALNLPFAVWVLYAFIEQVPAELEEAAAIDGCGPFRVFFTIVLPLIRPGLAAAAIFTFRIAWNELILALVLTNRFTRTLPVAASLYIALPPLVLTFVAAKQILTGLTAGAVKG